MKKAFIVGLALLCTLGLTACRDKGDNSNQNDLSNQGVVTELQTSDAEAHESIVPWSFEEGEEIENPYYKKTVDEDGTPVYAVEKVNGQVAYLPIGSTVLYTCDSENCYYEKCTVTYKLDGEPQSSEQYQLYVTALAPKEEAPVDMSSHPDVGQVTEAEVE